MMIAARDGIRGAQPEPGTHAECPLCHAQVAAKCGKIVVWHWAHVARADCDPWAETPGPWHREWQESVQLWQREIVIGAHRADIVDPKGRIIELQDSAISPAEIAEREQYYTSRTPGMAWVFNAAGTYKSGRLDLRQNPAKGGDYRSFRWKQPRKSLAFCQQPVFLDLGPALIRIGRVHWESGAPYGGYGWRVSKQDFRAAIRDNSEVTP